MPRSQAPHESAVFFRDAGAFRTWLERHHGTKTELWVGYCKKGSGRPSMTWPESVDEALCFGWIDGIRRSVDGDRYAIRFTPRRPRSRWSAVNLRRVAALTREGRMRPPGLAAWKRRDREKRSGYTYESASAVLPAEYERALRARPPAWAYFQARPPGYRRTVTLWVTSAAREETRLRRLAILADCCARERPVPLLDRGAKRS